MRERSFRSIGPNLAKSTCGHGSRPARPPPVAAAPAGAPLRRLRLGLRRAREHRLDEGLHVVLRDPALRPAALDLVERHAELARELPDRRRGVRQRAGAARSARAPAAPRSAAPARRRRRQPRQQAGAALARRGARWCGCRRRRGGGAPPLALHGRDQAALGDLVADLDLQRLDDAGRARRNLHRRLVALDRDQALLDGDRVAGLDQDLDHRDLVEVADVGNDDLDLAAARAAGAGAALAAGAAPLPRAAAGAAAAGRGLRRRPVAFEQQQQRAFVDLVADLDLQLLDDARGARRNLHRRLVALDRDQRLLGLDAVAGLTSTSMISTSLKSPMSGTFTSTCGHSSCPVRARAQA